VLALESPVREGTPALVRIPEGSFLMGEASGRDEEGPVHRVFVSTFEIGLFQVTNAEYARFVRGTGQDEPRFAREPFFSRSDQPVVGVSWEDASAYCVWLSERARRAYRLPTEAEWERAARGGVEGARYPWGDAPPESLPGYSQRWQEGPEPVGALPPNGFGLFDMGLNVHEWCADWFDDAYYAVSPDVNPKGPEIGERRASRGGSWRHQVKGTRCAARSSLPPGFRYADYGFRVAADDETAS
jgi:sulfatase modifying factor 1